MRNTIKTVILFNVILFQSAQLIFAEQTGSPHSSARGRIVHFPSDRSMGSLWIQDEGIVNIPFIFDIWTDSPEEYPWEILCPAQGDVFVPYGKRLSLNIAKNNWKDLSPLKSLKPNDLYQLTIYGGLTTISNPNDTCMPHIAHLTGLKHLELKWSHISNKGLQSIKDYDSLEYLFLPERINDSTLTLISQLKSLKGLYISGTGQVTDEGFAALQKLPSLEEITIDGPKKITSRCLRHLSKIPSLKKLSLYSDKFTDEGLIYLRDFPQLKTLMLDYTNITDSGLQFFSNLQQLENLSLYSTQITDAGIPHLVALKSLRRLRLDKWPTNKTRHLLTDKSMHYIAKLTNLECLELNYGCLSDFSAPEIKKLPNLKILSGYPSREKPLTNAGFKHLAEIKSLEYLKTSSPYITDEGIASLNKLTNLQDLKLSFSPKITDKGLSKIANMKNLKKISLTVSIYGKPEETYVTISGLTCLNEMTNLKSLGLSGVIQDGSGLNLSNLKNLESLHITCKVTTMQKRGVSVFPIYQSFTDEDLACLANLKNLQSLILRGSGSITDKGLIHLKDLTKLNALHLDEASLTGEGLIHLQGLTDLESLYLAGTSLDQGLAYFKNLKKLNELCISGDFSEKGLQHLKELKSIQTLYLYPERGIPRRAIKDLKKSLPLLVDFQLTTK
jgi:hypothetical protein